MNRLINVGRMQLINRWTFIGIPLTIMGVALAVVVVIGLLIPGDQPFITGAGQAPLWYFFGAGIQALTLTFPFSQGLSISRRTYFIGTSVTFGVLALLMALLYFGLSLIEKATNGWGVSAAVYNLPWVTDGPWYQTILFFWMVTLFFFFIGFWAATIYKRWSTSGLLIGGIGLALILLAAVAVLTWTSSWGAFWRSVISQTPLSLAGILAGTVVVLIVGSFGTLRRALP